MEKSKASDFEAMCEKVRGAFESLLESTPGFLPFLKYIGQRKRTATISDVPQLMTLLKKPEFNVSYNDLVIILTELTRVGIGIARKGLDGREKFYWGYWLFPIFDASNERLLAMEIEPIDAFEDKRNHFNQIIAKVEKYRLNLLAGNPNPNLRPDIVFDLPTVTKVDLSRASTDDLVAELERRQKFIRTLTKSDKFERGKRKR